MRSESALGEESGFVPYCILYGHMLHSPKFSNQHDLFRPRQSKRVQHYYQFANSAESWVNVKAQLRAD